VSAWEPPVPIDAGDKPATYRALRRSYAALVDDESDFIANAANLAALVFAMLPSLNWAGCYLLRGQELVLGPFQGKPACVRIALGRGVCGTAAQRRASLIVPDVHAFPGHIACDAASRSELVVPVIETASARLLGVFDLDSPVRGRFDATDRDGVEALVRQWVDASRPAGAI
jgi:L-methionine (R)-S-oxide reductase